MPLQDLLQGVGRRDQIMVNVRQAEFVLVLQECQSHMFFKEAAEITGFQKCNPGNLVKGNGAVVVLHSIFQDAVQPVEIFRFLVQVCLNDFHAETVIELEQYFKKQAVEARIRPVGDHSIYDQLLRYKRACKICCIRIRKGRRSAVCDRDQSTVPQ